MSDNLGEIVAPSAVLVMLVVDEGMAELSGREPISTAWRVDNTFTDAAITMSVLLVARIGFCLLDSCVVANFFWRRGGYDQAVQGYDHHQAVQNFTRQLVNDQHFALGLAIVQIALFPAMVSGIAF